MSEGSHHSTPSVEARFTRHGASPYKNTIKVRTSDEPESPIIKGEQILPDLTEAGMKAAEAAAETLFDGLDPEKDLLFFVSTDEARGLSTADIYRKVAKRRGFEISRPEQTRNPVGDKMGEGEIRVLKHLSLNIENTFLAPIFNPESQLGPIDWSKIKPETRAKWEQARAIILTDDRGSFAANLFHHGAAIEKIVPEVRSARTQYEQNFKGLLRLLRFAEKKAQDAHLEKNLKVMAFGHENYIGHALNELFGEHDIKNVETVSVHPTPEGFDVERRGKAGHISNAEAAKSHKQ